MKPEFFQGALDMEQPYRPKNNEVDHYFKSLSILDRDRGGYPEANSHYTLETASHLEFPVVT